jgi:hypothetical protein
VWSASFSPEEFDEVVRASCGRWEEHSIAAVRAVVVDRRPVAEVALEFGRSKFHVYELRKRFVMHHNKLRLKVPARIFMSSVSPSGQSPLAPLRPEIMKLIRNGYSTPQVFEFLRINDVDVSVRELVDFLKGRR